MNINEGRIIQKKKASYADLAYEGIKKLILEAEIEPGSLLSENELAEYLNMSRTPIREAIRRLEAQGTLYSVKGVGTFLKPLTRKDLKSIYDVRSMLELLACETAIQQITDEEIEAARAAFQNLRDRHDAGEEIDRLEFSRTDGQLHDLLVQKSDNEYIQLLMDQIYFNVDCYRVISFRVSLDLEESTRQHLDLLDCIQSRDLERLKADLKRHLEWSMDILLDNLEL